MANTIEGEFQNEKILIDDLDVIMIRTGEDRIGQTFDHVRPNVQQSSGVVDQIEIIGQLTHVTTEFQFERTENRLRRDRQVQIGEERRREIRERRLGERRRFKLSCSTKSNEVSY